MRESIGGLSLFQIVILFLLLFTAIMCFTINHSRAFAVKDEIVSIIENSTLEANGSLSSEVIKEIADRLGEVGHRSEGTCNMSGETGWEGYDRNGNYVGSASNALFCVKMVDVPSEYLNNAQNQCVSPCQIVSDKNDYPYMYYYNIKLFYQLDVPIVEKMNFNILSSTKVIYKRNS